jgi:ATP-dependent helicase Lhr and Lhr-like helicase
MFVAGLGAAQFAMPSAVDMLRSLRTEPQTPEAIFLAATDPANPYGTLLHWPRKDSEDLGDAGVVAADSEQSSEAARKSAIDERYAKNALSSSKKTTAEVRGLTITASGNSLALPSMSRTRGAGVILINGELAAFFRRMNPAMRVFLPESEPGLTHFARELSKKLAEVAIRRQGRKTGLLIGSINDVVAREHFLARFLEEAGFVNTTWGFQMRRVAPIAIATDAAKEVADATNSDNDADEIDAENTGTA